MSHQGAAGTARLLFEDSALSAWGAAAAMSHFVAQLPCLGSPIMWKDPAACTFKRALAYSVMAMQCTKRQFSNISRTLIDAREQGPEGSSHKPRGLQIPYTIAPDPERLHPAWPRRGGPPNSAAFAAGELAQAWQIHE